MPNFRVKVLPRDVKLYSNLERQRKIHHISHSFVMRGFERDFGFRGLSESRFGARAVQI
jgi:hypothetical protein